MHVCLFDIDGTLLSSGGAGKAAMEAAVTSAFGVPASAHDVPFSGRTDRAIARDLFQVHGVENSGANWHRFVAAYLEHLPRCLDSHQGKVLPGIRALLDRLSGRPDVAVGLLTGNVRDGARLKLGHYRLFHHFSFGAYGDHHLERDDVARDAREIIHGLHNGVVDWKRVWIIGDTPLDIRCARCIGARVLAVATGWHSLDLLHAENPDLLLADLADAAPLLAAWGLID
jgi:phosphoglycolate phosphatase